MELESTYQNEVLQVSSTVTARVSDVLSSMARQYVGDVVDVNRIAIGGSNSKLDTLTTYIETSFQSRPILVSIVDVNVVHQNKTATVNMSVQNRLYSDSNELGNYSVLSSTSNVFVESKSSIDRKQLREFLSKIIPTGITSEIVRSFRTANAKVTPDVIEKAIIGVYDSVFIERISTSSEDALSNGGNKPTALNGTQNIDTPSTTPQSDVNANVNSTSNVNTDSTQARKAFVRIEGVSDDTDNLLIRNESNLFVTPVLKQEDADDLLTRDDQQSSTFRPTGTDTSRDTKPTDVSEPTSSVIDNSTVVSKNESSDVVKNTEAQRQAEFSNSISKEKPKRKSTSSTAGTNSSVVSSGGKKRKKENAKSESVKDKQVPPTPSVAKEFIEWVHSDGKDDNGIVFRGSGVKVYNSQVDTTFGLVEKRFKNLFNFGTNLSGIFGGYSVESPLDCCLLMNSGASGRVNKNWPYLFGEGSEIHSSIILANSITKRPDGGIGTATVKGGKDANWAETPYWCGYYTNFVLNANGRYFSDSSPVNFISTSIVESLYKSSPFNSIPKALTKSKRISLETRLDEIQADTTGADQKEVERLRSELENLDTIDTNGQCVLLTRGRHFSSSGLTPHGLKIIRMIKDWPGAVVVRRPIGHIEVLLHITELGAFYTIGGNTGLRDANGNGSEHGVKKYPSIDSFCGKSDNFYIYKRGMLNPYTNGIGVSVKRTATFDEYESRVQSKDKEVKSSSYNVLISIMEQKK